MLRDSADTGSDGILLSGYSMDDIDSATLQSYRNEFDSRNPDHHWSRLDNKEFLRNLGGLTKDRRTGEEWLTMAGLLMFGKGLSIRERFGNLSFDYLNLSGLLPGQRWSDRISVDGTWYMGKQSLFFCQNGSASTDQESGKALQNGWDHQN